MKQINIPCSCAGGFRECGFLRVIKFDKDSYEFCWTKNKKAKRTKIGVCVEKKDLTKLKKFLEIK